MDRAKQLRRAQTDAEAKLWSCLRAAQLGAKFRRQHPVAGYYADFCCVERGLIVELDGGQHGEKQAYDAHRSQMLEQAGFKVLRFWNDEVLLRTGDVLEAIVHALGERPPPLPSPLPRRRRGRGSQELAAPSFLSSRAAAPQPSNSLSSVAPQPSSSLSPPLVPQRSCSLSPGGAGGEGRGEGEALASALHLRAHLYRLVRNFFADRHVLEVETPILSAAGNTDPNIESFATTFSGHVDAGARQRWMRTSPEFPLKRLLAAGVGDCYELGRVFRNGEAGGRHNPEFTMLEWYRVGWDHRRLADEVVDLVQAALGVGRQAEVQTCSYRELFLDRLGLDPLTAPLDALQRPLAGSNIDPRGLTRDDWLDLLITHRLQPAFPRDRITVIRDYPASQCALARIRPDEPPVAERFELYLGPYELANGYHELNDALEQRARFERDNAMRRARGLCEVPIDERLLAVLDAMPACAGVALGVERLLMCLAGTDAIADVLAFPFNEA